MISDGVSEWRVVREYLSERECNKWKFDCSFSFSVKLTNFTPLQLVKCKNKFINYCFNTCCQCCSSSLSLHRQYIILTPFQMHNFDC